MYGISLNILTHFKLFGYNCLSIPVFNTHHAYWKITTKD